MKISDIISGALSAARKIKTGNLMRVEHRDASRRQVKLTTVIKGKPVAFITADANQLDEFIRLLRSYRADMVV
jgi:hypothetical protein